MGSKTLVTLLALDLAASAVMLAVLPPQRAGWIFVTLGIAMVILLMIFVKVVKPSSVALRGMELISSQDLNNRLAKVGERNADKVVELFNALITKLRHERLRNMEQDNFLRLLIEESPMGVMILDFDGNVSLVNKSMLKLAGIHETTEVEGRKFETLHGDMIAAMAAVPLGRNDVIRCGDVRMYRCYHLSFLQTGFRRRFYLLESLTEEVMRAERRAYENVIRTISHEVNNTMGGVRSVLGLMYDNTEEQEMKEVIGSCDDRCEMMCSFIRSYADVVKVPDPVMRDLDLGRELTAMMPFLRELAGAAIELTLNVSDGISVRADMALLQQVVVNIVKNAVESISGNGRIELAAGCHGGVVWLEISNDGEPISEEVSHKLFTPFFTTKRDGRGLGLTLVGEILRRHDALFSLQTDSGGVTRFRIEFRG